MIAFLLIQRMIITHIVLAITASLCHYIIIKTAITPDETGEAKMTKEQRQILRQAAQDNRVRRIAAYKSPLSEAEYLERGYGLVSLINQS